MDKQPTISIVIPIYAFKDSQKFLHRCLDSITMQSFKDYEIIVTNAGGMAHNTNEALKKASGELVKILYMDDYLAHEDSLQKIIDNFTGEWLVTGCAHDPGTHHHLPTWNDEIYKGKNTVGSPSVLTMKRQSMLMFDESLTWVLDCDLYWRLFQKYGLPTILNDINVVIGVGEHQTTHFLADEIKTKEYQYLNEKYASPLRPSRL